MPVSLKSVLEGETRNDLVFHFVGILVFKADSGHAKIRLFFSVIIRSLENRV